MPMLEFRARDLRCAASSVSRPEKESFCTSAPHLGIFGSIYRRARALWSNLFRVTVENGSLCSVIEHGCLQVFLDESAMRHY